MSDSTADLGSSDNQETNDPFSPENASFLNFIMQARIYDALMALLTEAAPDLARDLIELHAQGNIMGPSPSFNGVFITDEVNTED